MTEPLSERAATVSDEAVAAALAAVPGYQRQAREAVWLYPSQGQARVMLEAGLKAEVARAEKAEATLDRVRALAESFATAAHPTLGGTFAATIGLRFLEVIKGGSEEGADRA